jgi:hypothetical protein
MKRLDAANDKEIGRQIARTRQVWQPRLGPNLSDEDARQIMHNVTGFFGVLAEWARAERFDPANDVPRPPPQTMARCAMKAEAIAKDLGGRNAGGGWTARCPAHDDGDSGGE